MNRRTLLSHIAAGALTSAVLPALTRANDDSKTVDAIAFDAFAIFDPRPIVQACERTLPGRGTEVAQLWRTRQFEYQWLRALSGHYVDFWDATRDALAFAASAINVEMSDRERDRVMQSYLQLDAWPDVKPALNTLRAHGIKLALLSNATSEILEAGIANARLEGLFDAVISTDRIRSYKPDPRAYQLGLDILGLRKQDIVYVAFAGWDVAGAKWFGYRTFWNNRQSAPAEHLDARPDGVGATLRELLGYLRVS